MIKFTEVIERRGGAFVSNNTSSFEIREVYINPEHIVLVREEPHYNKLSDASLKGKSFSRLVVNRGSTTYETTVVGTPNEIYESINNRRTLFKG